MMSPKMMVQKRFAAKKANVHQNPGMKSNSPAGVAGTKRAKTIKARTKDGDGNVGQKFAAVKKGMKAKQQPKVKAIKPSLKNGAKAVRPGTVAPSSYGGKVVTVK